MDFGRQLVVSFIFCHHPKWKMLAFGYFAYWIFGLNLAAVHFSLIFFFHYSVFTNVFDQRIKIRGEESEKLSEKVQ